MYSGSRACRCARSAPVRVPPPPHARTPPAAGRPARPRAPPPPPRAPPALRSSARLDLAQLDPEAAHLHLLVQPAQELQRSRPAATAPGRPCGTAARPAPRRTGRDEALRRQLRPAQVAARQPRAADVQLARHAHRHRLAAPRPARRPACWRSAGRWGRLRRARAPPAPQRRRRPCFRRPVEVARPADRAHAILRRAPPAAPRRPAMQRAQRRAPRATAAAAAPRPAARRHACVISALPLSQRRQLPRGRQHRVRA